MIRVAMEVYSIPYRDAIWSIPLSAFGYFAATGPNKKMTKTQVEKTADQVDKLKEFIKKQTGITVGE